jgi:thiosulfate/3-mercaptopyruvate sulfurtransferase
MPEAALGHGMLVDCAALAAALQQRPQALQLLDATVDLRAPRFDGDYCVHSGREGWLAERLPGALHADLQGDLADTTAAYSFARASTAALGRALARLGVVADRPIVVYDRSDGFWAARLWWVLRSAGVDAAVLDGGLRRWKALGLPLAGGAHAEAPAAAGDAAPAVEDALVSRHGAEAPLAAHPAALPLQLRAGCWADRAQIEAVLAGRAPGTLVNALSPALFEGRALTRYARRGRIPGSRNLPARSLFDAEGRYLRGAALAAAAASLASAPRPWWLYCGGGISAAAAALALTLLGETEIAIYDGSLQEWAADPSLPLSVGADTP